MRVSALRMWSWSNTVRKVSNSSRRSHVFRTLRRTRTLSTAIVPHGQTTSARVLDLRTIISTFEGYVSFEVRRCTFPTPRLRLGVACFASPDSRNKAVEFLLSSGATQKRNLYAYETEIKLEPPIRLAITGLPADTTDADIQEIIEPFPGVVAFRKKMAKKSPAKKLRHRVIVARIQFDTEENRERAFNSLHRSIYKSRRILACFPSVDPLSRLWIGGVAATTSSEDIKRHLEVHPGFVRFKKIQSMRCDRFWNQEQMHPSVISYYLSKMQRDEAHELLQRTFFIHLPAFERGQDGSLPPRFIMYLGNLHYSSTRKRIHHLLEKSPGYLHCRSPSIWRGGETGFTFVTFDSEENRKRAIQKFENIMIRGQCLVAEPRSDFDPSTEEDYSNRANVHDLLRLGKTFNVRLCAVKPYFTQDVIREIFGVLDGYIEQGKYGSDGVIVAFDCEHNRNKAIEFGRNYARSRNMALNIVK